MSNSIIYYGYDASPFVRKLEKIFLLRNIPASRVEVGPIPPRPELVNLLGLAYRRVPVLAIGRDLYADSYLITIKLERLFSSPEHPSMFPPRKGSGITDVGLHKALSTFYAEKHLFDLGFANLPWTRTPPALQADRKKFIARDVDFVEMGKQRSIVQSTIASHLALIEEQLADGREWFFDTEIPSYTDVSLHFILEWMRMYRPNDVFDPEQFPRTIAWHDRLSAVAKQKRQSTPALLTKISGEEAAKQILSSPFEDISSVGFNETEAKRLGVILGGQVAVAPDDTGKEVQTYGKLIALNREELVIETAGNEAQGGPGPIRVHFPRLGFTILNARASVKL